MGTSGETREDDPTWTFLAHGDVTGVLYMDIAGFRDLHTAYEPRSLTDLAVLNAVYRPGHMAHGTPELLVRRKRAGDASVTVHPAIDATLAELLAESWGMPVFEEQIVAILGRLAGIVPARAEWMRRSMAMNRHTDADGIFAALAAGLAVRGFPADAAEPLGSFLYEWTPYGFRREHCLSEARRVLADARQLLHDATPPDREVRLMNIATPEGWKVPSEADLACAKKMVIESLEGAVLHKYYNPKGKYAGAAFAAAELNDPFDITKDDISAVKSLSMGRIPRAAWARLLDDGPLRSAVLAKLHDVSTTATLAKATTADLDVAWAFHVATKAAVADPNAKNPDPWVIASKLTARKRPLLIPVRDRDVAKAFGKAAYKDGQVFWLIMRRLVLDRDVQVALKVATDQAQQVADGWDSGVKIDRNPLRVIDVAVWMTHSRGKN